MQLLVASFFNEAGSCKSNSPQKAYQNTPAIHIVLLEPMKNFIKNKIICGDCVKVLETFPDEYIDLVVASPPYDNARFYKTSNEKELNKIWNFEKFKQLSKELYRVMKKGGVIVWVCNDAVINGSESGTSFRYALYFKEIGFNLHDTMIYMKNSAPFPEKNRYYQCFEYMFVISKGTPKTFNPIRDRKVKWKEPWGQRSERLKDGRLIKKGKFINYHEYSIRRNIWKYNTGYGFSTKDEIAYKHPAIFPEQLAIDHIRTWTNEGDLVLDPLAGSCTTCKAAKLLKRNYICIDIFEEYCKIGKERLKKVVPKLL